MKRKEILKHLLSFDWPLDDIQKQLIKYEWDSEILLVFKKDDLKKVLDKYMRGEISNNSLEQWANIMESREDIAYAESDHQLICDIIFILANPEISGEINKKNISELIKQLIF